MLDIFNFSMKRNFGQALIFYFSYLILSLGLAMIGALVISLLSINFNFGPFLASIMPVTLSVAILRAKNRWQPLFMFLAGVSFFLGGWSGAILGMIVPAYLSTLSI